MFCVGATKINMDLLKSFCRLCLDRTMDITFYEKENLIQDITVVLGIKIDLTESLPNGICTQCFDIIKSAKNLKELSTNNDIYLHNILSNREKHIKSITNSPDGDGALVIDEDYQEDTNTEFTYNLAPKRRIHFSDVLVQRPESTNVEDPQEDCKISIRSDLFSPGKSNELHCEKSVETNILASDTKDQSSQINDVHCDKTKSEVQKIKVFKKSDEEIPRNCKICGKDYSNRRHYYNHKRTHAKSYPCPIIECGKLFATKNDVEKHIRVHTGEKPYECHICQKRFSQRCTLRSHLENIHANIFSDKVKDDL